MGEGKSEVLQGTHYQARGMNAEDAARMANQGYDRPSRGDALDRVVAGLRRVTGRSGASTFPKGLDTFAYDPSSPQV